MTALWVAAIRCGTYSSIMFRWFNHSLRVRGAMFLVAIYAFCVVAPPSELAVTNGALSSHCSPKLHSHDHSTLADLKAAGEISNAAHDEVKPPFGVQHKGKQNKSKICCGMLCIPSMASETSPLLLPSLVMSSSMAFALDRYLVGVECNLLNRPPIAL